MNTQAPGPQLLADRAGALTEVVRLKREVESLQGRLAKLNEVSLGIAGSLEIDTVLQAVIDASRLLSDARYVANLTFDEYGELGFRITAGNSSQEHDPMTDLPEC